MSDHSSSEDWNTRARARLERADLIERLWKPITDRLLELVALKPGDRVLDIGTGHGEPALTARQVVGPTGSVVAIDLSPEMIAIARRRAAEARIDGVTFLVQDAQQLNVPEKTFDAAVCRLSLMFVSDVGKALEAVQRALVPGGRFAVATTGAPDKAPQWNMTVDAIVNELGASAPPAPVVGAPGIFALSDLRVLRRLYETAGYKNVQTERRDEVWEFASPEEVATWHTVNPTIMELLGGQPDERRKAAWRAVIEAARSRADSDGRVQFTNEILYTVGERPTV